MCRNVPLLQLYCTVPVQSQLVCTVVLLLKYIGYTEEDVHYSCAALGCNVLPVLFGVRVMCPTLCCSAYCPVLHYTTVRAVVQYSTLL